MMKGVGPVRCKECAGTKELLIDVKHTHKVSRMTVEVEP